MDARTICHTTNHIPTAKLQRCFYWSRAAVMVNRLPMRARNIKGKAAVFFSLYKRFCKRSTNLKVYLGNVLNRERFYGADFLL